MADGEESFQHEKKRRGYPPRETIPGPPPGPVLSDGPGFGLPDGAQASARDFSTASPRKKVYMAMF